MLGGLGGQISPVNQIIASQNGTIYINTTAATSSASTYTTWTNSSSSITQSAINQLMFQPATQQNLNALNPALHDPDELWDLFFQASRGRRAARGKVPAGFALDLEMADGSMVKIDAVGNYKIVNPAKKIVYKAANVRAFNKYLNASDLIAKFVAYLDTLKIKKADVLGLPMELFIHWLVIESAKADGEDLPDGDEAKFAGLLRTRIQLNPQIPTTAKPLALPAPTVKPRCGCGRFLSGERHSHGLLFCSGEHMDRYEPAMLGRPRPVG